MGRKRKKRILGKCSKCGEIHFFDQKCNRTCDFPVACREYNYISRYGKPIIFSSEKDADWFLRHEVNPDEHKDYRFEIVGDIDQFLIFYQEANSNGKKM